MIRRGTKIQLVAFLVITVLGISFVSARYVGLVEKIMGTGYVVTADFAQGGGIFENAEVTYRGVTVGRVDRLRLAKGGVHVDLRLDGGTKVPADTKAVVENRSAVGEQYVDLQPRRNGGPFLEAGSQIKKRDTQTPLPTETLLLNLDRLVQSVDKRDLAIVIDELGAAFAGSGPDLRRLIDSGDALTKAATDALPETIRLIRDGETVLDTQRDSGSSIRSFSKDLTALSDTLVSSDGDLRKVLDNGIVASNELDAVIKTNSKSIAALLANLLTTGQVTVTRIRGLEQLLVTYPDNVAGGFTVVPGDGTSHFGLVLNASDPPVCTNGYESTDKRTPQETTDTPANTTVRCEEPRGSKSVVRGAQNAPKPGSGSARSAPGGSAQASQGDTSGTTERPLSSSYVAAYDETSGLAFGPSRSPLLFGSTGGQAQALGKDSWKWLLLGPLSK